MVEKNITNITNITNVVGERKVNWVLTLIMSIIFGAIGVDRFMMGHIGLGILKLITFGGFGIWWLIDLILIATKHKFKNIVWE
jgi:TM2 domain-containing membrane protein YozV